MEEGRIVFEQPQQYKSVLKNRLKFYSFGGLAGISVVGFELFDFFLYNTLYHAKLKHTLHSCKYSDKETYRLGLRQFASLFFLSLEERFSNSLFEPQTYDFDDVLIEYVYHVVSYPLRLLLTRVVMEGDGFKEAGVGLSKKEKIKDFMIGLHVSFVGKLLYRAAKRAFFYCSERFFGVQKPKEFGLGTRLLRIFGYKLDQNQLKFVEKKVDPKKEPGLKERWRSIRKLLVSKLFFVLGAQLFATVMSRPLLDYGLLKLVSKSQDGSIEEMNLQTIKKAPSLWEISVGGIGLDTGIITSKFGCQLLMIVPAFMAGLSLDNLAKVLAASEKDDESYSQMDE